MEKFLNNLRNFLGLALPISLSFILLAILHFHLSTSYQEEVLAKKEQWSEKTKIMQAFLNTHHKASQIYQNQLMQLCHKIENQLNPTIDENSLKTLIHNEIASLRPSNKLKLWFFKYENGSAKTLNIGNKVITKKRIMSKLFESLVSFSSPDIYSIRDLEKLEKFSTGILGHGSSPKSIGLSREGKFTPVNFNKKRSYLYWRKLNYQNFCIGGILAIAEADYFENEQKNLQRAANNFFIKAQKKLAVAFLPLIDDCNDATIILPEIFKHNSIEKKDLVKKILKVQSKYLKKQSDPNSIKSVQKYIFELGGYVFQIGNFSIDIPYKSIIFAPIPKSFALKEVNYNRDRAILAFMWFFIIAYFYLVNGAVGLPLKFSFRMLFFLSGLIPIAILNIAGSRLINDSYKAGLIEARQRHSRLLSSINEKSNGLLPIFGLNVIKAFNKTNILNLFLSNSEIDQQKGFHTLAKFLSKRNLAIDYMVSASPNEPAKNFIGSKAIRDTAKVTLDLMAPSCYKVFQLLSKPNPEKQIQMNGTQKNWHSILKNVGKDFLEEIFLTTYEKENYLSLGGGKKDFFYSMIFTVNNEIEKLVNFIVNSKRLKMQFVEKELNSLNFANSSFFLGATEKPNSDFYLFPLKSSNFLNSTNGKLAFNFMKYCKNSEYETFLRTKNSIFYFSPLNSIDEICACSIISLDGLNKAKDLKELALICFSILVITFMFILSSIATSHLLLPLGKVKETILLISNGNLDSKLDLKRTDELGTLAETINVMTQGFKKRLRLGKFVSKTLEENLAKGFGANELEKSQSIYGTILFCDIRDFTTLSESISPTLLAKMLNEHLERMVKVIQQFDGQVEQFIGDAIVAFFPNSVSELISRTNALNAAIKMRLSHENAMSNNSSNSPKIEIGVGIAYGNVLAGAIKGISRSEFIVLGNARTSAENLETLSKKGKYMKIIMESSFKDFPVSGFDYVSLDETSHLEIKKMEPKEVKIEKNP